MIWEWGGEDDAEADSILSFRSIDQKEARKTEFYKDIESYNRGQAKRLQAHKTKSGSTTKATYRIQGDFAHFIETEKAESYTFQLVRRKGEASRDRLLNVVFYKTDDGGYKSMGVGYDFTPEQAETFRKEGRLEGKIRVVMFRIPGLDLGINSNKSVKKTLRICDDVGGDIMDCGSLGEVTIEAGGGGSARLSGGIGGGGSSGSGAHPQHLLKLAPGGGGGGGAPTTPTDPDDEDDPCEEIASLFDSKNFENKFKELNNKTGKSHEYGYAQDKNGEFTELKPKGDHSLELPSDPETVGFLHTHPTTPMFSPADFLSFRNMLNGAAQNGRSVEDVYGIMLHDDVNYILKFDGNYEEVSQHLNNPNKSKLKIKYNTYFERYSKNPERAFIKFIEEVVFDDSIKFEDGFHLYEIKTDKQGNLIKSTEQYANKKSSDCK